MNKTLVCLLIDDDEDDREIFSLALRQVQLDVDCVMVNNGQEAIRLLNDTSLRPDYIFVDINLPIMNGKECVHELKKLPRLKDSTLILYSTSSVGPGETELEILGASKYITKVPDVRALGNILLNCFKS